MGSPVRTDTVQLPPHYVPAGKVKDLDFQKNCLSVLVCFYAVARVAACRPKSKEQN